MRQAERVRLLHGPYRPPALRVGQRSSCLFKDCDVVVTGWTAAPIPWPCCLPVGRRGHPSLLVDEELARAVRNESAAALKYWFGVSDKVVWKWRTALGVSRTNNEGSRRLIRAPSEAGASRIRGRPLPPEEVERRRRTALEMNLGARLRPGYHGPWWTPAEEALLGTDTDEAIARRIGRTAQAVRIKRTRQGIATARGRGRR